MTVENPLGGNQLRTFGDVADAVRACYEPVRARLSPGGARVRLGSSTARFSDAASELEGFARPLWGLAPLGAGGGEFAHWDQVRAGLVAGTDPSHVEYWGEIGDHDQRMVEMAAIGAGLLLVPEHLWLPLEAERRDRLATWLRQIDRHETVDNNWHWFRVLIDLGLARVGEGFDERAHRASLARIERFARDDGWYTDGDSERSDWYVAFAFHTYGLLYAASGLGDPAQAQVYLERAAEFARSHRRWFAPDGSALAFGRSMTYRFAQAAFWGALAIADVEALPWGQVKGIYLRNLRSWSSRSIADADGVLDVGYAYRTDLLAEGYISPGSPYWANKGFLGLGAGPDHPIWTSEEEPLDWSSSTSVQRQPGLVLSTDAEQVLAVNGAARVPPAIIEARAKYGRLAYSSRFGFSADDAGGVRAATSESTLVVVDEAGNRVVRGTAVATQFEGDCVASRWDPWPGVSIDTVLWPAAPWHVRAHRISTSRPITVEEWGFALGFERPTDDDELEELSSSGRARARSALGTSGLIDVRGRRTASIRSARPNVNLLWPRTAVPLLIEDVGIGTHERVTLVFGSGPLGGDGFDSPPAVPERVLALLRARADGAGDPRPTTGDRLRHGGRWATRWGRRLVRKGRALLDGRR